MDFLKVNVSPLATLYDLIGRYLKRQRLAYLTFSDHSMVQGFRVFHSKEYTEVVNSKFYDWFLWLKRNAIKESLQFIRPF